MFGKFSTKLGPIALDLSGTGIKLAQVRVTNAGLRLAGATVAQRPEFEAPDEITACVREALSNGRFSGRRCVVNLPRELIHAQSVRLPAMAGSELREAVLWEAVERFGLDHHDVECDYIWLGEVQQGAESRTEVLVLAAARSSIRAAINPLIAGGLRPTGVGVACQALTHLYSYNCRRENDRERVRVLIELGSAGSQILFLRGDTLAFCKSIEITGQQLDRAVAEHLQIDEESARHLRLRRGRQADSTPSNGGAVPNADATDRAIFEAVRPILGRVVKETSLCLRYFGVTFRGRSPEIIHLTGEDAGEPHLPGMLEQACKVGVEAGPPDYLETIAADLQHAMSERTANLAAWSVPVGMSVLGTQRSSSHRRVEDSVEVREAA